MNTPETRWKQTKFLITIIFGILGLTIVCAISSNLKAKAFQECIDKEPTDWVCDSCWQVIYHEPIPFKTTH